MSHNETFGRSLSCTRYTQFCVYKGKAIVETVSYLSNDLTCGLSPMDTSPVLVSIASAESGSLVYW